jgi:hypothetical protein
MRCLVPILLALTLGCEPLHTNRLAVDNDDDGFTEFEGDCDDQDKFTFPGAAEHESETACMTDADEDGWGSAGDDTRKWSAGTDCDDDEPRVGSVNLDLDCDGAQTEDDCDDDDP